MKKSNIYLYEYPRLDIEVGCYNSDRVRYWKELLGGKVFEYCEHSNVNFKLYLAEQLQEEYLDEAKKMDEFVRKIFSTTKKNKIKLQADIFFQEFYHYILDYGIEAFKLRLKEKKICLKDSVYEDFSYHVAKHLQSICLRTIIAKMHEYKKRGVLVGNSSEEYIFFCENIVGSKEFVKEVLEEYPVLCRCVSEKIEYMINFYEEIIVFFQQDRMEIIKHLCEGQLVNEIINIKGDFSDVHNNSKQVMKIKMNNNKEILYKPHSMKNEKFFDELLEWTREKTNVNYLKYPFLSYDDHSWSTIVEYKSCKNEQQLEMYYFRLGVQLFWAYLLGTKDLHFENIIASGEYPVLIDLETLVNVHYNYNRNTSNEEIIYQLSKSVLYTGILPYYSWNYDGKGINNSAISGGYGDEKYPFKVPVVLNSASSEMKIGYEYPKVKNQNNLATVQGEFYPPEHYKNNLIRGFSFIYKTVIRNKKEVKNLLVKMKNLSNRYLIADTQQYAMFLSSSFHPSLLKDGSEREIFFNIIRKGRSGKDNLIVEREIKSLLNGDIPYFTYEMDDHGLFDINGIVEKNYFEQSPFEIVKKNLSKLNEKDLNKQCELIEMSLIMTSKKESYHINKTYKVQNKRKLSEEYINKIIDILLSRIMNYAIWNKNNTEVNWSVLQITSSSTQKWIMKPMGYYLYDGLAGMYLLFETLNRKYANKAIKSVKDALEMQLFNYTDQGLKSLTNLQSRNTGAYDGESSIVYTYLTLYKQTSDLKYIVYAEKHAQILKELIRDDCKFDLISGNAGAAFILMKLYEEVPKKEYFIMAEDAIEVLDKNAIKMERGMGWITEKGILPMAGMAHGNAGVLMTLLEMWKKTNSMKYMQMAWEVWEYENSLYDEKISNWTDLRIKQSREKQLGTVAWCHGVSGILLSRLVSIENLEDKAITNKLEEDIFKAVEHLQNYYKRDSWCLCHGLLGNLWILEEYQNKYKDKKDRKVLIDYSDFVLLPQETMNPGMLNGYGGILYYLLKRQGYDVANILKLE